MRRVLLALSSTALLLFAAQPSRAQILQQPNALGGGRLSIDTATGARCDSSGADRPSISIAAGQQFDEPALAAIITVPFGGPSLGDCSKLLKHEEARSRLELAAQLFEAGVLSVEEFKAIADDIASLIR